MQNELDELPGLRILAVQVKKHFTKARESRSLTAEEEAMVLRATQCVERLVSCEAKTFDIILNGMKKKVDAVLVSYEDVMVMAGRDPRRIFSVTWAVRGQNRGGILAPGETVRLEAGMVFNAYDTSNA
jgi:hypothetical protein